METQVSRRIRELREAKGLTQTDLAQELGVAPVTVYRWENGTREISLTMLTRVAAQLETEPSDFFPKVQSRLPLEVDRESADSERRIADIMLASWQEYLNRLLDWTEELREKFAFDMLGIYSPEEKVVQVRLVFQETRDFLRATGGLSTADRNLFGPLSEDSTLLDSDRELLSHIRQTIAVLRFRADRLDQHVEKIRSRAHDLKWLQEQVDALDRELVDASK